MLQKLKVQPPIKQIKKGKETAQKWKNHIFFGHHNQYRCSTLISSQGGGKSSLILQIIDLMCDPKKSNLFWVSSLTDGQMNLDSKIMDLQKKYNIQFITQQQVDEGGLKTLYDFLYEKRKKVLTKPIKPETNSFESLMMKAKGHVQTNNYKQEMKEYKEAQKEEKVDKYYQNMIVLDDIQLSTKNQSQLSQLCKNYRHLKCSIFLLSQSPVQQSFAQLREIMNCHILGQGITNKRLNSIYWPELKINIDKDVFCQMYRWATSEKYSWFVIDNRQYPTVFQQNFNFVLKYVPDEKDEDHSDENTTQ